MLERLGKREPTVLYRKLMLERLGKREPADLYRKLEIEFTVNQELVLMVDTERKYCLDGRHKEINV